MKKNYSKLNKEYKIDSRFFFFLFFCFVFQSSSFGQCTNGSPYGSAAAPTNTTTVTISTCTYQSEYNTITGVAAGASYQSTYNLGGCITVHQGTWNGPVVAWGPTPLNWTATVAGNYYIHYNVDCFCTTDFWCGTSTITCTSCGGGSSPCTSITNIAACGSAVTANLNGTGDGWNITACGFTTSGDEQIYSFTPATSGNYSLNITNNTGGFIDYFWVNSTSGCSSTAPWNCIDDVFSAGVYGSMAWTAGQTYYILLDPEGTGAFSATFAVNCISGAGDPCASITNIASCGTSVTANLSGTGASWNIGACGFSTPGDEQIYSFTPTTTGTYSLNITNNTGGYIDYFWINSTSGCSSAAPWNCIDDIFSAGTYGAMAWTAGQTYYILLDPEGTGAYTATFSVNCVTAGSGPCATSTTIVGCGASYSGTLTGTGVWNTMPCGFSTPGVEIVYSYTATSTGNHLFNFTAITGGFIDVSYQAAVCNSTGWTCIDDVISVGQTPAINLTAGTTYYFLLDPEGTGTFTYTFNLDCPGTVVTASDCNSAVNICDNANFQIDPNGYGSTMEIPPLGTVGNPDNANPGGSANWGCLRSATIELNSTWMVVNIATSGNLEFSFGAGGAQAGFYDWIMYPYNPTACAQIPTGNYAPVRCNWNGTSSGGTGVSSAANLPAGASMSNFEVPLPVLAGEQYVICFSNYSSAVTSVPLNFFGTATVSCTALPAELLNFAGDLMNQEVLLTWKTMTETNTSHFRIEHSTNGIDFVPIGNVNAQGNSNVETNYSFIHRQPEYGTNYYRLITVDINSDYQTSHTVTVDYLINGFEIIQIFPNPTDNDFSIVIQSNEDDDVNIEITDITGKRIYFAQQSIGYGNTTLTVPSSEFANGVYNLIVTDSKSNYTKITRLYKQQ